MKRTKSKKDASIDPNTLWCLLLYSMRYALGRMSSAPSDVAEWIRSYRGHLEPWQINQIADEVEEELRRCESQNRLLGHRCDHQVWTRLVADLRSPP